MIDNRIIQAMAKAERMMDEGKLPWVLAPSPAGIHERMPVPEAVMKEFELEVGQKINSMIRDAITEFMLGDILKSLKATIEKAINEEDPEVEQQLSEGFDFRDMIKDGEEDEPTKH